MVIHWGDKLVQGPQFTLLLPKMAAGTQWIPKRETDKMKINYYKMDWSCKRM